MIIGENIDDINVQLPKDVRSKGKEPTGLDVHLVAVVRDANGKVIKVHKQRSHSPTANFIGLMLPMVWFSNTNSSFTITNTTGGTCGNQPGGAPGSANIAYPNSGGNHNTYLVMIQVGSGQLSNPYNAHTLAAPISNGTGAGQLSYGSVSVPSGITVSGGSAYFTISQSYTNNSGNTITITEVGIIVEVQITNSNNTWYADCGNMLVWYDVLSSPISIPNNGGVTIYYTFSVGS